MKNLGEVCGGLEYFYENKKKLKYIRGMIKGREFLFIFLDVIRWWFLFKKWYKENFLEKLIVLKSKIFLEIFKGIYRRRKLGWRFGSGNLYSKICKGS